MSLEKRRLTVISGNIETEPIVRETEKNAVTPPNTGYHTNPMYEKLLKYKEEQKRKRFTVEDLLKW